jgi:hypothetical protein
MEQAFSIFRDEPVTPTFDQSETLGLYCRSYRLPRRSPATAGGRRVIRHLLSILRFMGHVSFYATGDLPWQF